MKKFQLAAMAFFALLAFSCLGPNGENNDTSTGIGSDVDFGSTSDSDFSTTSEPETGNDSFFGDDKKPHDFKDEKTGLTVYSIEYPSTWKVLSRSTYESDRDLPSFQYRIQGPSGLNAFNGPNKNYVSYSNPQMQQLSQMNGTKNIRPLISIQQLIQQDIAPAMAQKGFRYEGVRPLPQLERFYKQKVTENALAPAQPELIATVWRNDQGKKALVTIGRVNYRQQLSQYGTQDIWFYSTDYLIADADSFDNVVSETVQAQLGVRENPQWKNHSNRIITQRTQVAQRQSTIAHNNRMAQQQASFNAHQERMRTLNATQDANHASFMNRNFGSASTSPSYSGGGQQDFLNMINEEETVYNPGDGQNYQIESGAKETWMDSDGSYIKSDDLFYDPNADNNLNQGEWSKVWEDY